jgi:hypothetical protein
VRQKFLKNVSGDFWPEEPKAAKDRCVCLIQEYGDALLSLKLTEKISSFRFFQAESCPNSSFPNGSHFNWMPG